MGIVPVEITGIAAGGEGVGRLPDGRAVFVHRTAPGELVQARVVRSKRNWARARLVRVERPARERRTAPCPHYDRCGGCTLEHLEYGAQLRAKSLLVADALRRIGGIETDAPEVVASPHEFRYRNRVAFTLVRLGGTRVVAGFHALDRPGHIVDIPASCLLPEPLLSDVWGQLRDAWGEGAHRLPSGRRLRLTLRATAAGSAALLVDGGYTRGEPEELLERVPGLMAIEHRAGRGSEPVLLAGEAGLVERWAGEEREVGGTVFLQVNRAAAAHLEVHVLARAREARAERIVDAYCGVGVYARQLALDGANVIGIELDAAAAAEAARNSPPGARFVTGTVEDHLAGALPAELVIANPPRAGLDAVVIDTVLREPPRRILYVSCDPATLARDADRLGARFRLGAVRCFDLFPQTAHVETVAELECATS